MTNRQAIIEAARVRAAVYTFELMLAWCRANPTLTVAELLPVLEAAADGLEVSGASVEG